MQGDKSWPVNAITYTEVPDIESVTEALKTGPYGRCVYDSDNNVVDNQVIMSIYRWNKLPLHGKI